MIREKKINAEALVSHRLSLDDFMTGLNMMLEKTGSMKIVIEPTG
jgi:threonine dehydrogenase-like Zn-dependent dehydrogenase